MRLLSHMSLPFAVLAVVLAGPANASAQGRTADGAAGHSTGYVYLDNNTARTNTISGFSRSANGALTALPGSPFVAGGAGLGAGIASQGAIRTADDGQYLLAVDAGSNQISVLRVGADGSLTPVPGSPFASGGVEPDSIAVNNGLVYVSNTGAGGTNYTGFTLSPGGQLHPIPGSTVTLPDGSGPGDVVLNGDNTKLVGTRVNTSLIDSFTLNRRRAPARRPGSPLPRAGPRPVRQRVPPHQSRSAVRLQCSQRQHGPGPPSRRSTTCPERHAVPDRRLAVRQFPDRAVLAGRQPRWAVRVRARHRIGLYLELRDRPRRDADAVEQHARQFHPRGHRDGHRAELRRSHALSEHGKGRRCW